MPNDPRSVNSTNLPNLLREIRGTYSMPTMSALLSRQMGCEITRQQVYAWETERSAPSRPILDAYMALFPDHLEQLLRAAKLETAANALRGDQ